MLFWEVLQCNKRFRSFIVDTDRAHDFVVLILFHAVSNRNDPTKQGIVRMCVFVLQTLSVEDTFGARLNKTFHGQETLPPVIRLPNFHGTYADFLIIVSCPNHEKCLQINKSSTSTPSSRPVKESWTRYTQHYLPLSTTSRHMSWNYLGQHLRNSCNFSTQCPRRPIFWLTRRITLY
jgi:hypothetical protein